MSNSERNLAENHVDEENLHPSLLFDELLEMEDKLPRVKKALIAAVRKWLIETCDVIPFSGKYIDIHSDVYTYNENGQNFIYFLGFQTWIKYIQKLYYLFQSDPDIKILFSEHFLDIKGDDKNKRWGNFYIIFSEEAFKRIFGEVMIDEESDESKEVGSQVQRTFDAGRPIIEGSF